LESVIIRKLNFTFKNKLNRSDEFAKNVNSSNFTTRSAQNSKPINLKAK